MKTVLITGGSRGIGKATVQEFHKNGYQVIATSTTGKSPFQNKEAVFYQLDLGNQESIKQFVQALTQNTHTIDVLINNAMQQFDENNITIEILKKTLAVNLVGTIDFTLQILPLIKKGGVIINVSSEYGSLTEDWGNVVPSYRIEKAALNMFTRNFYKQVEPLGIKVYSFDPGWVKTDMGGPDAPRKPEEPARELLQLAESGNESGLFYRGIKPRAW